MIRAEKRGFRMRIIVDAFGGDNAPLEMIKGAQLARQEYGVDVILCGESEKIQSCAKENGLDLNGLEILEAEGMIPVEADPTTLLKDYANCSMAVGLRALKEGKAEALVSAGSTGALVVGASLIVKRIKGVRRTAIPTVIPNETGCFMLIDSGANAECSSDMLVQFGMMGSVYMNQIQGVASPRVGLVNIGTEENKGLDLHRETYQRLKQLPLNFIGNVEARGLPLGECDVAVCNGFTGNVTLKLIEGMAKFFSHQLKGMLMRSTKTKLAALLLKDGVQEFKQKLDYSEYGGAPLLGISRTVIKAHGSSDAKAIKNAIRQAKQCVEGGINETIAENLVRMKESAQ
jgi:glycerol-3-phosphate acyltransferase PlsX